MTIAELDIKFDQTLENLAQLKLSKNKYQEKWELRSSVRSRPRKFIDFAQDGYFFPEDKQPLLLKKEISALGEATKETILIQSFLKYLNDIVNLEIKIIISACNKLLYSNLPVTYTDEIKLNTYSVMIDEYYHVYVAKDMILQLSQQFPHLSKLDYPISDAHHAVTYFKSKIDSKYHDIFEILSVCIFETTLVRELVEFFNSPNVHPSIKHYVNDHMNDEARHYNFFYDILCYTWERLPDDYKENIGKHLAQFIKIYLHIESDKNFYQDLIKDLTNDPQKSASIVENLYRGFDITPEVPIVKNVIQVLKRSRLLDNPHVFSSFQEIGWKL